MATVVLVLLLALLLRPVIESSAEDAAADAATDSIQAPLQRAEEQIAALAKKIGAKPPPALTKGDDAPSVRPADGRLEVGGSESFSVPEGQTLLVTDLILENPDGNSGTLIISRNDEVLLEVRLDNFRDLDYHFVSPIVFGPGAALVLRATCSDAAPCSPALYYVGTIESE
ncbi:MAG TPA: hypothetical protein VG929_04645 [Actinomycetota bacterium]|nr:hypothetical protein [Actinomycetota bacterium]